MKTICAQKRDMGIKAKKLRRLGFVPATVLGKSLPETLSIQLKESDARQLLRQEREGSKMMLDTDGEKILVQMKEREIDAIKGEIQHISFQVLTKDEKVNSLIHILLTNEDKVSGQLEKMMMEIPYASLPGDMIDTITVDLDGIKTGTVMLVRDIPELMNDGIELQINPEDIVFRISERRAYKEETSEE